MLATEIMHISGGRLGDAVCHLRLKGEAISYYKILYLWIVTISIIGMSAAVALIGAIIINRFFDAGLPIGDITIMDVLFVTWLSFPMYGMARFLKWWVTKSVQ
ncbi:hypothetical protein [Asticcacaulis sp. AND118]|uniref:hypothetical protein n=1 Tax=Asticcacaulis sp. AND118 TaxID=2840468 RepID=UPI001CFF9F97|nr:hypothetical protein [Asticcacaulis sp. AND118]UDF03450.1 hypothetical protein LH365_13575 [Asticcacaulis sp. AND118]